MPFDHQPAADELGIEMLRGNDAARAKVLQHFLLAAEIAHLYAPLYFAKAKRQTTTAQTPKGLDTQKIAAAKQNKTR